MDLTPTILQVIDFRSFSSIWFWLVLAALWSSMSYYVLGIPYDVITRAKRHGGQAQADLADLTRLNVNRLLTLAGTAGLVMTGVMCFVLSSLAVLGFVYWIQFAQAAFLLLFPLSIAGAISITTAARIQAEEPSGEALLRVLMRHRLWTQILGMTAIFVTAMFGMAQNLIAVRGL
ncbi:component of SufBCD complex [Salipiger sp. IMCC34102]|uniref:component of SufBCD complex n=1 Tax=Salipiger sp. IMCC34102 TaxID=2510647 RepID=UPI00101BF981|nr:component of SufBCD complex [Salipiger sp. IMCC34102]RYH03119.1 component of SufBCD complex [Salipiger sp. IMCC34102]